MKRYQKDGFHAEHDEGVFVLYEDAKCEIDELKTRLAEAEAQMTRLKAAMHRISLGAQNSMLSKKSLERVAYEALAKLEEK
jgi:hypothetical protein